MNESALWSSWARASIPTPPPNIIKWAEANVVFPSSVRSNYFKMSITPWLITPLLRHAHDPYTKLTTLVKPVQSGGSVFGEVYLLYAMMYLRGFLQYNWSNDKRADERWESRIGAILKSCDPVRKKLESLPTFEAQKGEIDFGNIFFRMQGAFVADNLDSDSVSIQLNEEVHAWELGHLAKARNRQTAVWNAKGLDISNASKKGDQLHQAYMDGTQELWEVKCPGCRQYHRMRTRWEDRHPELGGLRYNVSECKREDGTLNYEKMKSTIHFQMPCSYIVHDDTIERRALSSSGQYSAPTNTGADLMHRSYTYEAVSVDYISWLQLIKDKHDALRARRYGDLEQWFRYLTERECVFYDPDDVPIVGRVTLSASKKSWVGLEEPRLRLFSLDKQRGNRDLGEIPHWWLVIRDFKIVDDRLKSLLVFEGKVETDENVISILDEHKCNRWQGVADSGDDTTNVYVFCLRYGINAIKGGKEDWYVHPGGNRRIFSVEKPLHAMINRDPMFPYVENGGRMVPDPREPLFWLYSKSGIRERLYWLRAETDWQVPSDASDDYQKHMEAEERVIERNKLGAEVIQYVQHKPRNDLYVCECYIAMQAEQASLVHEQAPNK